MLNDFVQIMQKIPVQFIDMHQPVTFLFLALTAVRPCVRIHKCPEALWSGSLEHDAMTPSLQCPWSSQNHPNGILSSGGTSSCKICAPLFDPLPADVTDSLWQEHGVTHTLHPLGCTCLCLSYMLDKNPKCAPPNSIYIIGSCSLNFRKREMQFYQKETFLEIVHVITLAKPKGTVKGVLIWHI